MALCHSSYNGPSEREAPSGGGVIVSQSLEIHAMYYGNVKNNLIRVTVEYSTGTLLREVIAARQKLR